MRFELTKAELEIYPPDGKIFLTSIELAQQAQQEKQRAEQAEAHIHILETRLRQMGIDTQDL